jgi:hypothetical protein
LQKKALRIITKSAYNSHTEPLFKTSGILPLKYLISYFKLLFMYDYTHEQLPESFYNTWMTNQALRNIDNPDNDRVLRDDNLLNVPFVRLEQYLKFPLSDFPRLWNDFDNAVLTNSRNSFKIMLKEHFLEKLSYTPNCTRLLCPACHL